MITTRIVNRIATLNSATLRSTILTGIMFPRFPGVLSIFFCLILWSCKKNENFSSKINFVNASIGSAALTMKVDSNTLFSGIRYDTLLPNIPVPSGTSTIGFSISGGSNLSLLTNLEAGATYTGVLYDSSANSKLFIQKDALPATPGFGRCAIRIYNMITASTNLYLANTINVTSLNSQVFSFGNFTSNTAFSEIDTFPDPSIRIDSSKFVVKMPPFRSGKIYSIFLLGSIKDSLSTGPYKPEAIIQTHN